jgi:hypothetical protein
MAAQPASREFRRFMPICLLRFCVGFDAFVTGRAAGSTAGPLRSSAARSPVLAVSRLTAFGGDPVVSSARLPGRVPTQTEKEKTS